MKGRNGFTMIELMITITIIAILSMISYAPYNYYQNKAKLKITAREISQILYESHNMAKNGAIGSSGNVSIGVFFENTNVVKIYSFPHDINNIDITYIENGNIILLEKFLLPKGVKIDSIENNDNLLFYFDSITGNVKYYYWLSGVRGEIDLLNSDSNIIDIQFSYKGSTSSNLRSNINYFTNTNIIDY